MVGKARPKRTASADAKPQQEAKLAKGTRSCATKSLAELSGVEKKSSVKVTAASKPATVKESRTASGSANKQMTVGLDSLPAFEVEVDTSTAAEVHLKSSADIVKETGAIIFFVPKANTGGCTKQAQGFNAEGERLLKAGYKLYCMSADKPKSMANWKAKYDLKHITFLSDPTFEALKDLGVYNAGKIKRSHIIIAKGGLVEDIRIGVSPGESVTEAVKFVFK